MSPSIILKLAELGPSRCLAQVQSAFTQLSGSNVTISCTGVAQLPCELLGPVLHDIRCQHGGVTLEDVSAQSRLAIRILDPEGVLGTTAPVFERLGDVPFHASIDSGSTLVIRVLKGILDHPILGEPHAHDWLRGLSMPEITVDLGIIEHVNSLLVAWLLQLSQVAAPIRVTLINLSRQVTTQLGQLRLNHLMRMA